MEASLYSIIQWSKTWNILEPEQRGLKQQRLLCSRHLARTKRRRSGSRSAGLRLDTADLVDIVLHQLGVVELEVSVHGTLPKKLVVVVVLVLTSLNHGEVLAVFGVELVVAALDDGELADVVVDRLLAGRCPLQQSDGVVWSVDIIEGCMRLPSAGYYVLHQVHSGHRCGPIQLLDLCFVSVNEELVQVVLSRGLVVVPHVGVLGRGDFSAVGKVDVGLLGERSIDVFVVDVLDHWLIVVAAELLVVVVDLHPGSPPRTASSHLGLLVLFDETCEAWHPLDCCLP